MHDTIDSEFCQLGNLLRESASEQVGIKTDLSLALQSLVGRIERGMTIELKFLPLAANDERDDKLKAAMEEIRDVVPNLTFPSPSPTPVIALPRNVDPDPDTGNPDRKAK